MKILRFTLPRDFNLYLGGDDHIGTIARHDKGFAKMCDTLINDPIGYFIHHGDYAEAITIDDTRFDYHTTREGLVLDQIYEAHRQYDPIKKRMLVMLSGNHPYKLMSRYGDITLDLLKRLYGDELAEDRYGHYSAKIHYYDYDGNLMFKHYATHGSKSINSVAEPESRAKTNMKIALVRNLKKLAGDCLVMSMGHTHRLLCKRPEHNLYITDDGDELIQNYTGQNMMCGEYISPGSRWYVNTGSFLKTFVIGASTYSERAQYPPTELGYYKMQVRDGIPVKCDKVVL